jgi:deoxycytidylate deaminase
MTTMHETTMSPPQLVLDALKRSALSSTCRRSRRGAACFLPGDPVMLLGLGHNGLPTESRSGGARCPCPADFRCGRTGVAVHAEARALLVTAQLLRIYHPDRGMHDVELVHLEVTEDGQPVVSGPPSCMTCASALLDASIGAVWLLHEPGTFWDLPADSPWSTPVVQQCPETGWTRYPMFTFYNATTRHHQLPDEVRFDF